MEKSIGKKLFRGTLVVVIVGIMAKIAAFLSETILAAYLGTSYQGDAYYMVSSIQQVVYPMLSAGIWKVFLPIYKEHITKNEIDKAYRITNKAISFFTVVSLIVTILIMVLTGPLVSLVAPGFEGETRRICIILVRISAPMYIFIISSAVYASILQSHNKFFGSQIREVVSHIPTILAAVLFYKRFGVYSLAIALVIGGLVRLIVELPFVDWGYKYKPDLKFKNKEFGVMLKRLPSALISEGVTQLNTLIDKAMASTLPEGTISALNYGHRLMNVFSGLLSTSIATALYPQMIELIATKKEKEISDLIVKIINIFCVLMVPVTFACVLFRSELVSAVYERGSFDADSTVLTSGVFALYSIGILFIACNTVITNLFYGYGDTKTPMYISVANLLINVVLNLLFIKLWGANGLALATSLSAFITFFIRIFFIEKRIHINNKSILISFIKISVASVAACLTPRIIFNFYSANKFIVLIASGIIGVLIYLIMLKVLRVSELNEAIAIIKKKAKR